MRGVWRAGVAINAVDRRSSRIGTRHLAAVFLRESPTQALLLSESGPDIGATCIQVMTRRSELRNRVAAQWAAAGIDVLLCPAGPSVAPKLNTARYWNVGYPSSIV